MYAHLDVRSRQRGASLVMTLIILVLLTLIGVSALTVSNTQSRLAGNIQLQTQASLAAESALAAAENWLSVKENTDSTNFNGSVSGLYPRESDQIAKSGKVIDPLTMTWSDNTSIKANAHDSQRYIIELYAPSMEIPGNSSGMCSAYDVSAYCPKINLFRITARGVAPGGSVRLVQTIFAVRVLTGT